MVTMNRNGYVFIPLVMLLTKALGIYGTVWAFPVSDIISMVSTACLEDFQGDG